MRGGLFSEIIRMSWETVRGNKMRSALTILGIVIGITSLVGMISLIRGFDESFKDSIRSIGPDTVYLSKFSGISMMSGASRDTLMKRPSTHSFPEAEFEQLYRENVKRRKKWLSQFIADAAVAAE